MKTVTSLIVTLVLLPLTAVAADPDPDARVDAYRRDVQLLAADDMEGRGLGTRGIEKAAAWIEKRMRETGFQPAFGKSYQQPFPVKIGVELAEGNSIAGIANEDWTPLGFSSSGSFDGEIVFAGYGIEAAELEYQELKDLDLRGKVAMILRYEPQEGDDNSKFDGKRPSRWSSMRYKTLQARERGAIAVVFVTGPLQDEPKDRIPPLRNDGPESPAGIPVLQVKTSVAQIWLAQAGIDLAKFQRDVDADLNPRSRPTGVKIRGRVAVKNNFARTSNVAGVLPGRGALANEIVVLGAHYDHLGFGGAGSLRGNSSDIHNGADDNASGVVAVLHAAARLKESLRDVPSTRTILFALFSAEESGLGGSSYFVANPPRPMDRVVAMVNLDMVGRLRDDKLIAFGTDSAPQWSALVAKAAAATKLKVTASGDGYGPSDQTSFYAAKIPVLHFFTGGHDRYHTPDDDADSLNYEGAMRIVDFTTSVVEALARGDVKPTYTRASAAPLMAGDSRGYGAYLGTVPDYSAMEATSGGVKLADVRPGSPAERAGLRGGDRIVEIGGTRVENLYDMTYALQDQKPGNTVDVVVMRGEQRLALRATLAARGEQPAAASPHAATASGIKAGKPFDKTFEGEAHFRDVRQLTFGGENAEAYFSPDGMKLIYQATVTPEGCDQQYVLDLRTGESNLVSSGKGRTTCGYFSYPKGDTIIYASTAAGGDACPPPPDRSRGYVWAIYPTFDLWLANADGSNAKRITTEAGYDAEATWCHRGGKFVFTSMRDGDLDLYEMTDEGKVRRLTNTPGYDGGAFYNADCTEIVFRASRPSGAALDEYRMLLTQGLVRPTALELFSMKSDGTDVRQITKNGAANFAPYYHPDGRRIIYSSNAGDPRGREFDLYLVDKKGGEPKRVTTAAGFDGFPMFSPDGKYIVWGSNRANPEGRSTNLFIAKWVDQ